MNGETESERNEKEHGKDVEQYPPNDNCLKIDDARMDRKKTEPAMYRMKTNPVYHFVCCSTVLL